MAPLHAAIQNVNQKLQGKMSKETLLELSTVVANSAGLGTPPLTYWKNKKVNSVIIPGEFKDMAITLSEADKGTLLVGFFFLFPFRAFL